MKLTITFHRRTRQLLASRVAPWSLFLERYGGEQTMCGEPVTEYDIPFHALTQPREALDWTRKNDGHQFMFCEECAK